MWRIRYRLSGLVLIALLVLQHTDRTPAQSGPIVAAEGDHFTVNGVPKFLLMASYFDALHATSTAWAEDLDYLQSKGYNGVRIFPNWFDQYCAPGGNLPDMDGTLFNHNGSLNSTTLQKLTNFLNAAAARGFVVDVTLGWDTVPDASGQMKTMDHDHYVTAVGAVANALRVRGHNNVIIDVQNEYTTNDLPVTRAAQAVAAVHAQDAGREASASRGAPPSNAANEARVHGFDFVAYHDFRDGTWYTGSDINADLGTIRSGLGASAKPIYYQEPMPFDEFPGCGNSQKDPTPGHHRTAAQNAKFYGAAAWTFHSRLSFELSGTSLKQRLLQQSHANERAELEATADSVGSVCWDAEGLSINPQSVSILGSGGSGSISVATNGACANRTSWTVTSDAAWLTATPASGTGNGTVTYTAAPNGQVARVGHLTIRGRTFTVSQAASQSVKITWQHRNSDGLLSVWFMNGLNKVGDALLTPSTVSDQQWHIVGTGDYNRDGQPDLFWQHQGTGELAVWRMGGVSGTEQILGESLEPSIVADLNWKVRTVADMDRDGYPDLIWQNIATGDLAVWWMNGRTRRAGDGGQPLIPGSVPPSTTWTIIAAGDVNRDGYPDLIWHKLDEGFVSVWFMQGRTQLSGQSVTPNGTSDLNWKLRGAGDLDRNGYPDLIWQNISTREVVAWLMTGLTQTSGDLLSGSPNPLPDTNWTVVAPK